MNHHCEEHDLCSPVSRAQIVAEVAGGNREGTVREDFWPVDTRVHGKPPIGRAQHRVQMRRAFLDVLQLSVDLGCCGIVKSSGDFYCFLFASGPKVYN